MELVIRMNVLGRWILRSLVPLAVGTAPAVLALGLFASPARADLTYYVDETLGVMNVQGSITTDGDTGQLTPADITATSLALTTPSGSYSLGLPGGVSLSPDVDGFFATYESLSWEYLAPENDAYCCAYLWFGASVESAGVGWGFVSKPFGNFGGYYEYMIGPGPGCETLAGAPACLQDAAPGDATVFAVAAPEPSQPEEFRNHVRRCASVACGPKMPPPETWEDSRNAGPTVWHAQRTAVVSKKADGPAETAGAPVRRTRRVQPPGKCCSQDWMPHQASESGAACATLGAGCG